jgi:hypothetical protein
MKIKVILSSINCPSVSIREKRRDFLASSSCGGGGGDSSLKMIRAIVLSVSFSLFPFLFHFLSFFRSFVFFIFFFLSSTSREYPAQA